MKQRMSAAEAGRKGGLSRSTKKLAAAKRNGFQKVPAAPVQASETKPCCFNTPILIAGKEQ